MRGLLHLHPQRCGEGTGDSPKVALRSSSYRTRRWLCPPLPPTGMPVALVFASAPRRQVLPWPYAHRVEAPTLGRCTHSRAQLPKHSPQTRRRTPPPPGATKAALHQHRDLCVLRPSDTRPFRSNKYQKDALTVFSSWFLSLLMFLVHKENSRRAVTVVLHHPLRRGRQGEGEKAGGPASRTSGWTCRAAA